MGTPPLPLAPSGDEEDAACDGAAAAGASSSPEGDGVELVALTRASLAASSPVLRMEEGGALGNDDNGGGGGGGEVEGQSESESENEGGDEDEDPATKPLLRSASKGAATAKSPSSGMRKRNSRLTFEEAAGSGSLSHRGAQQQALSYHWRDGALPPPILLMHGQKDDIVSVERSRRFARALLPPVRLRRALLLP